MAIRKSLRGADYVESMPKKTRQGNGKHTKYAASSRNNSKKKCRGQGRCTLPTDLWTWVKTSIRMDGSTVST